MDIHRLPSALPGIATGTAQLHEYQVNRSSAKSKVRLSKHVFSFLLEGSKELITSSDTTLIGPDKFLFIRAGNCLMSETLSPSHSYKSLLFFLDDAIIRSFLQKHHVVLHHTAKPAPFSIFTYDDFTRTLIQSLRSINAMPDPVRDVLLPVKCEEIFLYLMHQYGSAFLHQTIQELPTTTNGFVETMQKNALNNLSLQELAFLCNMSVATFKRHFEKEFGTSPIRWFLEQRLTHSAYLLHTRKLRPSDIYFEVGFESLSGFIQAYKQKFGTTPKQSQLAE